MPYQYKREPLTQDEATRLANACQQQRGYGQLVRALLTERMISLTVIWPSAFASAVGQSPMSSVPRAMLTALRISSTVTTPSPLQSPKHAFPTTTAPPCRSQRAGNAPVGSYPLTYQEQEPSTKRPHGWRKMR
jgi:hypothetical protein